MQHGRHRRHCSPGHHRTLPPWRDDHTAAGRPTQRLRNPTDSRSAQRNVGVYASVINGGRNRRGDTVVLA
jgi:hypothetical protein